MKSFRQSWMEHKDLESGRSNLRADIGYGPGRIGHRDSYLRAADIYGRPILSSAWRAVKRKATDPDWLAAAAAYGFGGKKRHKQLTRGKGFRFRSGQTYQAKVLNRRRYGHLSKMPRRGNIVRRRLRRRGRGRFRKRRRLNKSRSFVYNAFRMIKATTRPQHFVWRFNGTIGGGNNNTTIVPWTNDPSGQLQNNTLEVTYSSSDSETIIPGTWNDPRIQFRLQNASASDQVKENYIFYVDQKITFEMNAFDTHNINVDIYFLKPRSDIFKGPSNEAGAGLMQADDLVDFINNCLFKDGQGLVTTELDWTPYKSSTLCEYFRVVKKKHFMMMAGKCSSFSLSSKKPVRNPRKYATQPNLMLSRMSLLPLFVLRGCVGFDYTESVTNLLKVGISSQNLGIAVTHSLSWYEIPSRKPSTTFYTTPNPNGVASNIATYQKPAIQIIADNG